MTLNTYARDMQPNRSECVTKTWLPPTEAIRVYYLCWKCSRNVWRYKWWNL